MIFLTFFLYRFRIELKNFKRSDNAIIVNKNSQVKLSKQVKHHIKYKIDQKKNTILYVCIFCEAKPCQDLTSTRDYPEHQPEYPGACKIVNG